MGRILSKKVSENKVLIKIKIIKYKMAEYTNNNNSSNNDVDDNNSIE
jgi:hypothetical protein